MADIANIGFRVDTSQLRSANKELDTLSDRERQVASSSRTMTRATNDASGSMGKLRRVAGGVRSAFFSLQGAAASLFGVISAVEIAKTADQYQVLQRQIRTATEATGDYARVSEELFSISQETGTALAGNVQLFRRLKIGAEELGRTNTEVLQLTSAINQLGTIGGASQDQLSNATLQLSQAMAGGIVRAEEFNSIIENTPMLAQAIARGLNSSVGELRAMVLEGELLADDVFEAILSQQDEIEQKFGKIGLSMEQTFTKATNALEKLIGLIGEASGASSLLNEVLNKWAESVEQAGRDMEAAGGETADQIVKIERHIESIERRLSRMDDAPTGMEPLIKRDEQRLEALRRQLEKAQRQIALERGVAIGSRDVTGSQNFGIEGRLAAEARSRQIIADMRPKMSDFAMADDQRIGFGQTELSNAAIALFREDVGQSITFDSQGAQDSIDALVEELNSIPSELSKSEQAMQQWSDTFASQLTQMAMNADTTFSDILNSFGSMIAQMVIKESIATPLASSLGSFIGGLGLPGFANGGRPPVGQPFVVGERGPEIMTIDRPGTVTPNHMIGGSSNVNINVNVSGANGNQEIMQMVNQGVAQGIAQAAPSLAKAGSRQAQNDLKRQGRI